MSSTDVALRPEDQATRGFELAEATFTPERREAIATFLNVSPTDPVLLPYLVTCATYGLSPVMGEVWLIPTKVKVRDGDATSMVERYRPAVGRDGFLSIARRDARYKGLQGAVVCEKDTFEVEYTGDLDSDPKVLHRFASKPTVFEEGEAPDRYRGKIIGAWAKAYALGLPPMFYFANLREHGKMEQEFEWGTGRGERIWHWQMPDGSIVANLQRPEGAKPKMTWAGAWDYVSPMILKAAQSYVLRILFGITGLAPADEMVMDRAALPEGGGVAAEASAVEEFDWSRLEAPEGLRERLRGAVESANELTPLSWAPAKIEMVLLGRPVAELEERADAIEREVELAARKIDPPAGAPAPASADVEEEPVGQVEEAPEDAVVAIGEQEAESLRHQLADLEARLEELEDGSEEHERCVADMRDIESKLRGAPAPSAAAAE